jgi:AmmeMemoRadiSam system protein A
VAYAADLHRSAEKYDKGVRDMKHILCILTLIILAAGYSLVAESTENSTFTEQEKSFLLNLARQTVCWHLKYDVIPEPDKSELSEKVLQHLGCFVTLQHKEKGLRGCIGIFERREPLYKNVITRAIAATHDSRFRYDPVTYDELGNIKIEISVLTKPKDLPFDSSDDLLKKLRPNIDGVILYTRYGTSTYLPQVWEQIPGKEDFLSYLCQKHGAPRETWKRDFKNIKVQTYQAIVFHEESYDRKVVGPKGAIVGKKGAKVLGAVNLLEKNLNYGGNTLTEGTQLAPGTIVTWESDIIDPK